MLPEYEQTVVVEVLSAELLNVTQRRVEKQGSRVGVGAAEEGDDG